MKAANDDFYNNAPKSKMEALLCDLLLKNGLINNVSISFGLAEIKQARKQLIKLLFMLIVSACLFAFWYPMLWADTAMADFATALSTAVAGGFLAVVGGFIKLRQLAITTICKNLRSKV